MMRRDGFVDRVSWVLLGAGIMALAVRQDVVGMVCALGFWTIQAVVHE